MSRKHVYELGTEMVDRLVKWTRATSQIDLCKRLHKNKTTLWNWRKKGVLPIDAISEMLGLAMFGTKYRVVPASEILEKGWDEKIVPGKWLARSSHANLFFLTNYKGEIPHIINADTEAAMKDKKIVSVLAGGPDVNVGWLHMAFKEGLGCYLGFNHYAIEEADQKIKPEDIIPISYLPAMYNGKEFLFKKFKLDHKKGHDDWYPSPIEGEDIKGKESELVKTAPYLLWTMSKAEIDSILNEIAPGVTSEQVIPNERPHWSESYHEGVSIPDYRHHGKFINYKNIVSAKVDAEKDLFPGLKVSAILFAEAVPQIEELYSKKLKYNSTRFHYEMDYWHKWDRATFTELDLDNDIAFGAEIGGGGPSIEEMADVIKDEGVAEKAYKKEASGGSTRRITLLRELGQLKKDGLLTEEEFLKEKKIILGG